MTTQPLSQSFNDNSSIGDYIIQWLFGSKLCLAHTSLALMVLFVACWPTYIEAQVDCASIDDPSERLDCYDRKHSGQGGQTAREDAQASPDADSSQRQSGGGLFDSKEKVEFTALVQELRKRDKQKMVFLLDNGQMWIQSSPRNLPFKKGDKVTIKSGLIGGYILRNERGVSTRVSRID